MTLTTRADIDIRGGGFKEALRNLNEVYKKQKKRFSSATAISRIFFCEQERKLPPLPFDS